METVLFLCTGNSCRSQMAEGILRHFKGEQYEVYSAGTRASYVNSNAIRVMLEIGIDISDHTSKHVRELKDIPFDIVVTVCDNAKESCPIFPGERKKMLHLPFEDPAFAKGDPSEVMEIFRRVRDEIKEKLLAEL